MTSCYSLLKMINSHFPLILCILLLITEVSLCKDSDQTSSKKIYSRNTFRDNVNGLTFGEISEISSLAKHIVFHAEDDLLSTGNLLVSSVKGIYSVSLQSGEEYTIENNLGLTVALSLTLTGAQPNIVTNFLQISETEILLVYQFHNCIRLAARLKQKDGVTVIAGKCEENGSHKDGSSLDARFDSPRKIMKSPTRNSFYIVENKSIRTLDLMQKGVSTLLQHDNITDAVLSPNKKYIFFVDTCAVHMYDISSNETTLFAGNDTHCGNIDGKLLDSFFCDLSSIVFLNDNTILVSSHDYSHLRIIDLCASVVSSFCLPVHLNGTDEKMYLNGSMSFCSLHTPMTLKHSNQLEAVMILSQFYQPVMLSLKKDQNMECKEEDVSVIQNEYTKTSHIGKQFRSTYYYTVRQNRMSYLNISRGSLSTWWILTASDDDTIQVVFHSLHLFLGESLQIYDTMPQKTRVQLKSYLPDNNLKVTKIIPDQVNSRTRQLIIEHNVDWQNELRNDGQPLFNISYSVVGYIESDETQEEADKVQLEIDEELGITYMTYVLYHYIFPAYIIGIMFMIVCCCCAIFCVDGGYPRNDGADAINGFVDNGAYHGNGGDDADEGVAENAEDGLYGNEGVADDDDADDGGEINNDSRGNARGNLDDDIHDRGGKVHTNDLGSNRDSSQANKVEDFESDDDGYNNLKPKSFKLENNIRCESQTDKIQAEIDANLQREDNKKINLRYRKRRVAKKSVADQQ